MLRSLTAILIGFTALALSTPAHAFSRAQHTSETSIDPTPTAQTPDLDDIAQGAIRTLDHSVIIFHYDSLPTPTTSYIPPNDPSGLADVTTRIENGVWDPQGQQTVLNFLDWMGYGFYAAIDPIISYIYGKPDEMKNQAYGGDAYADPAPGVWRLVALTLAPGTKYLDLTQGNVSLTYEATQALYQSGCYANSLYDLFTENSGDKVNCREPMRKILKDLGVGAVLYTWGSAGTYLTSLCSSLPQSAFYVTEQTVSQSQVTLLTTGLPPTGIDSASDLRHAVNSLWGLLGSSISFRPWPTLGPDEDLPSMQKWARANLFGCGP